MSEFPEFLREFEDPLLRKIRQTYADTNYLPHVGSDLD